MLHVSAAEVKFYARAKYYIAPDGECKLMKVQSMSFPAFRIPGYELVGGNKLSAFFDEAEERGEEESADIEERNTWRALHRAKLNAFDKILCNHDLDTFVTFTLSPEAVADRTSWSDVYKLIQRWLDNRVRRKGLKYVICPERHKAGGIHFHAIMNSSALRLTPASNAHNGEPLYHRGQPLYNVSDWKYGFTSAELIETRTIDREKVAKYIFKYMGKQGRDGKIGGRYVLIGGDLKDPIYRYSNDPYEFIPDVNSYINVEHYKSCTIEDISYREWSFI